MKLIEKILIPTDFRGSADGAIKMAISVAKSFNSEITLLHVLPEEWDEKSLKIDLKKIVSEQLSKLVEEIKAKGVKVVTSEVVKGKLLNEIIKAADTKQANLIMMGSGEKSEKDRYQLGSTTEKVMRRSGKPVWVMKRNGPTTVENIVCPVDYSDPSRRALRNAIHLAREFKAEITVLTVMESLTDQIDGLDIAIEPESDKIKIEQEAEFDVFLSDFDFYGVAWKRLLLRGKPADKILETINGLKNSLFIMGTNGRSGINKILMGSVTEKVTRELPSSFITVKSEEMIKLQLVTEIKDLEIHFNQAQELLKNGMAKEAIIQYQACLDINDLHLPAWFGMARAYDRLNDEEKAQNCRAQAKDIQEHFTKLKIEAEIRSKHWMSEK